MYDLIVIGSGPGGYAAAIRASQQGLKTAVIERAELGGTCLNWGCIPTKALLKSAEVYRYATHAADYGLEIPQAIPVLPRIVERSRAVAAQMSKGIEFLLKKNNIDIVAGQGALVSATNGKVSVEITSVDGLRSTLESPNVILATGARARELSAIPVDGERVITSRHALVLDKLPATMAVIGSGAIGAEFAAFYNALGVQVTIIEYAETLAPLEDEEISKLLERAFRKAKITTLTGTEVKKVETTATGCVLRIENKKGVQTLEAEVVLSAIGVVANLENIGLETLGVKTERGKILVDEHYRTNVPGVYAIGDIIPTPALAHVATAEAIHAADFIAHGQAQPVDYDVTPSCIYTVPELSSVGLTEKQAAGKGYELRIGRFPYTASGKATAAGNRDGMVKLIFDAKTDKLLGAHLFGLNVTELIAGPSLAMHLGATAHDISATIHAHPTMAEALMEAAEDSHGKAVHL